MGLSRNKVAVSEGAAGSPPFYGERAICQTAILRRVLISRIQNKTKDERFPSKKGRKLLFNFQGPRFLKKKQSVLQTQRVHPFPFRTRKLSSAVAKILYGRLYGKIVQCRHKRRGRSNPSLTSKKWRKQTTFIKWGCSSAGRAPALQAGGHGFESHHLHQSNE